jgi:hypothetical protein
LRGSGFDGSGLTKRIERAAIAVSDVPDITPSKFLQLQHQRVKVCQEDDDFEQQL